jgi:hypothetical protein
VADALRVEIIADPLVLGTISPRTRACLKMSSAMDK